MMWNSVVNFKENLNKIALDVHDDGDDEELSSIYNSRDSSMSDRRISHNFAQSVSPSSSLVANGFGSPYNSEIEQYKSEIRRLQGSESEIKALSVNYAALLKEKEDQLCRLAQENGSLKQNLDATKAALNSAKTDIMKASTNGLITLKGSDLLSKRQHKGMVKNRSTGSPTSNGFPSKQDGHSNGHPSIQRNEKELADLLDEKNQSLDALQATHESQMKEMATELDKERGKLTKMQLQLLEEQKLNGSFQQELNILKVDKDRMSAEMNKIRNELNKNISEMGRLQGELRRRDNDEPDDTINNLRRVVATLEEQNNFFKVERDRLEAALKAASSFEASNKNSNGFSELSGSPVKEMELSFQKLEKDLKQACQERDKALQELKRLKQHLLEKESEESEKMDEDSKIIEELRENNEYQRAQISHLEKALKQAIAAQEEIKMNNKNELHNSKEVIDDLNRRVASYLSTIDSKNVEILNLQTALGQYYAESEAKERLVEDLALARKESAKLSELVKDAYQQADVSKKEKDEVLERLSIVEKVLAEGRSRVNKLEEDNEKLRRALEQSMTRLNRMSMDSDYFVDRRIVIKLLVTYFQRNHSKEVLDLMVRMLGFSDEDKQRIGFAQQGAGKGVVRGVLGLPGRLVGGIMGGSSAGVPTNMASEKQSFADLWVDFLLKETEERERRESAEAANESKDQQKGSPIAGTSTSPLPGYRANNSGAAPGFSRSNAFLNLNQSPQLDRGNFVESEQFNSEFSTVPLNSSDISQILRQHPRY